MPWIREGECSRCGDCCVGNPMPGIWPDAPDGMCPLLELTNKAGERLCSGHGHHPYYMAGCVVWPSIPEHTAPHARCSYRWRWQD